MYTPNPVDTSSVVLPDDLIGLREAIAKQVHEVWAQTKLSQGKTDHPDLIPYEDLADPIQQYDRNTAEGTIKFLLIMGWRLIPPQTDSETV